jgi:hypothetical protein
MSTIRQVSQVHRRRFIFYVISSLFSSCSVAPITNSASTVRLVLALHLKSLGATKHPPFIEYIINRPPKQKLLRHARHWQLVPWLLFDWKHVPSDSTLQM